MTRNTSSDADERTARSDENDSCPDEIQDKAREVLKYDNPEQASDSVVRAHNKDRDWTQNETNHLIRTDVEWIAIRTWTDSDGETHLVVEDYGTELLLEWLKFDLDRVNELLHSEVDDAIAASEAFGHPIDPFATLGYRAKDVTRDLMSEWGVSAELSVRTQLTEGIAGWTGRVAWTDEHEHHVYECADRVATRFINKHVPCDVNDDVKTALHRICGRVLCDAVEEHRDPQTRGLTFAAEVTLID